MVILGLLLILLGALAIVAAGFVSDGTDVELLGIEMSAFALFLVGVTAGAFILWGFTILKYGTRRTLKARREHKQLGVLSQKLERVEEDRRQDGTST